MVLWPEVYPPSWCYEMSMVPKHVADWIQSVVAATPCDVRLVYIEWNDGLRGSDRVLWFNAFGYTMGGFDPEDALSLSALSGWSWETAELCGIPGTGLR